MTPEALAAQFAAAVPEIVLLGDRYLRAAAEIVRTHVAAEAPVKTGALRASVQIDLGATDARITATAPYAAFVLGGTQPHTIMPRSGTALRWEGSGGPVFARRVQHPGTAPNDFYTRGLTASAADLEVLTDALGAEYWALVVGL